MTSKKPKPNPMAPQRGPRGSRKPLKSSKEQAPPSPRNNLPAPGALTWAPFRALTY